MTLILAPDYGNAVTPSLADIAKLVPEYTRHPVDMPEEQAGDETGAFDEHTDPSAAEVQGYIEVAVAEVRARVGVTITDRLASLARTAAAWHAAAAIEAKKSPAGTDEADSSYRWKRDSYVKTLDDLIRQARMGPTRLA
jgi:hypothetical protein